MEGLYECVELRGVSASCVCMYACSCRLMMVGETVGTENCPRLQLIHILSSVLAQGSRVIWECVRHTWTHTHPLRKWERMMHAGQIYGLGLWSPYISPWLLQPEPGWVQAVYSGWVCVWCQEARSHCLSPCSLQAAAALHFSLKMINAHANYQSMGTHSNMGDSNQEIVIWKTI